jgi:hypothetical protein
VEIRFRGGATTTLTLPRPLTPHQLRATHPEVRQQIDALLDEYTNAQVANQLNKQQMRTGTGESFDAVSVQWVRFSAKLKSLKERLLEAGWLTSKQVAAQLGVSLSTVSSLRNKGRLKGRICSDKGEWLYWPPDSPTGSLRRSLPAGAQSWSGLWHAQADDARAARRRGGLIPRHPAADPDSQRAADCGRHHYRGIPNAAFPCQRGRAQPRHAQPCLSQGLRRSEHVVSHRQVGAFRGQGQGRSPFARRPWTRPKPSGTASGTIPTFPPSTPR